MSKILALYKINNIDEIKDILYTLNYCEFINKQNFTTDQIKGQRYIILKKTNNELIYEFYISYITVPIRKYCYSNNEWFKAIIAFYGNLQNPNKLHGLWLYDIKNKKYVQFNINVYEYNPNLYHIASLNELYNIFACDNGKCCYCRKYNNYEIYNMYIKDKTLYVKHDDYQVEIPIKYCPFCGQPL